LECGGLDAAFSMEDFRKQNILRFAEWTRQHVKGDEKGEAQIFLDHLFHAFGQKGCLDVGGQPEFRIRRAREDGGGTAFADYVWKPVVLIEMKRRGTELNRHYQQAFEYWTRLAPGRPRYVVLCNFDEFWVYDFDSAQLDTPVDTVTLEELPSRYGPLAFLFPTQETPVFGNYHEGVTRKAADLLAVCFNKLILRVERPVAQRFILQMLVAFFAEDIGLLEQDLVRRLLDECRKPSDSYDLLGGLFHAMNAPQNPGGRFKGVDYFNGGIFREPANIELEEDEVAQLRQASRADWSKVRPEIFGTLFEHSMEKTERHALGGHYTSPADIMKIVGPTITDPWREQIEGARTLDRLIALRERMRHYTVLDPACGSGNFLYLAYRELKRLEVRLNERITEKDPRQVTGQAGLGFVTARQFYGIDIVPFAVELAKVTMMIARKLAIDELHVTEPALPLDNLDDNFLVADALLDDSSNPRPWPKADVIIGNPPFLGAKRLKPERGADYVNRLRKAYPEIPGMADYCVHWIRRAHDHLPPSTGEDPVAGRAGLVGTQNIRNNQSRVGGLDYVVKTGTILEAVENEPWSGEANVHVSIVNWVKTHDRAVLPLNRKLWVRSEEEDFELKELDRSINPAARRFELALRLGKHINSSLSFDTDVSSKRVLDCNKKPKRCFQGKIPGYEGFLLDADQARRIREDSRAVVVPFLTGREMLGGARISRWAIDFDALNIIEAAKHESAFAHCQRFVLPEVKRTLKDAGTAGSDMVGGRRAHLDRWWQFWNSRVELTAVLKKIPRFIGCSRVTRRPVMVFISSRICPSDLIQVFAFRDDYSFGILQSFCHFEWFRKSSRLKVESDVRYSSRTVFETFPWPQRPARQQVNEVAEAGREVRRIRAAALDRASGGLRSVYRNMELPGKSPLKDAHAALDAAVLEAYGFSAGEEILSQLMELNLSVAARIDAGEAVTAPGVPSSYGDQTSLITDDCIRP
jgi:SAM-dependent methyltransferase